MRAGRCEKHYHRWRRNGDPLICKGRGPNKEHRHPRRRSEVIGQVTNRTWKFTPKTWATWWSDRHEENADTLRRREGIAEMRIMLGLSKTI